jgi:very-short-patch-repair endonuclease
VTTPRRGVAARAGIDVHRVRRLQPEDVTAHEGIPVTTVARTVVDLTGLLDEDGVRRAIHEAEVQRLFDLAATEAALERANGRRDAGVLRALLAGWRSPDPTASRFERRFLAVCRDHGLPEPGVNVPIRVGGTTYVADFLWREQRLVAETDGEQAHGTRHRFRADRRRDRELAVAGFTVVRFTWADLAEPGRVAGQLRALLARG